MFTFANFANVAATALTSADPHEQLMGERALDALRSGDVHEACRLLDIPVED